MKKSLLACLAVFLIVLGALLPLLRPPPSRVTEQNFHRIKKGMSQQEVEAVLGPPGDYRTGPTIVTCHGLALPGDRRLVWAADFVYIRVGFTAGRVTAVSRWHSGRIKVGPLERLRWRWDRWRRSLFK